MISAFKHIRLSGYNVTPGLENGVLRLGVNNSGLAYHSELTGVSGYLMEQINSANADVNSIFIETGNGLGYTVQNNVTFSGANGVTIGVDGQTLIFSGDTAGLSGALNATGLAIYNYNTGYSGWANAEFVKKSTRQIFSTSLSPSNGTTDTFEINYPTPFAPGSNLKIQATLEVDGDVMYNFAVKNINITGYTGVLSDNLSEPNAKIHTFASSE